MQMKKSDVAVFGPSRAMEMVPSRCLILVTLVRSSLIGGKSLTRSESRPACMTAIFTLLSG